MLFLFRSAPEVEKSKLFRKFWRSRGTKEPAYITVLDCCVGHLMKMKHAKHQQQRSLTIGKSTYQPPGRQCVRCSRSDASLKESEKLSLSLSIASVLGELTRSVFVGPGQTHHSPSVRFNQCLSTHCLRVCLPFLIQELGQDHSLVSIIPGFIGWVSPCAV